MITKKDPAPQWNVAIYPHTLYLVYKSYQQHKILFITCLQFDKFGENPIFFIHRGGAAIFLLKLCITFFSDPKLTFEA